LEYKPLKAVPTLSNAMDVGDPSNFVRILEMFNNANSSLSAVFSAVSFTDNETRDTIKSVYNDYGYLLDPHGAIGFMGLENYLKDHPGQKGIFAETAHPIKFYDVVEPVIGHQIELPVSIESIMHKEKKSTLINPTYNDLAAYLKEL
jgi:threonine synthase